MPNHDGWTLNYYVGGCKGIRHLEHSQMANIDAAKAKNTIFIGGLAPNVDENILVEAFSPFGLLGLV
jgi:RNA recognition motif-containing protein